MISTSCALPVEIYAAVAELCRRRPYSFRLDGIQLAGTRPAWLLFWRDHQEGIGDIILHTMDFAEYCAAVSYAIAELECARETPMPPCQLQVVTAVFSPSNEGGKVEVEPAAKQASDRPSVDGKLLIPLNNTPELQAYSPAVARARRSRSKGPGSAGDWRARRLAYEQAKLKVQGAL